MRVYYLDSSAWVKRYLTEPGSTLVRNLFYRKEALACCALGYAEVTAAIARQKGVRQISATRKATLRRDVLADWNEMLHAPLTPEVVLASADHCWDERLQGADAMHLAAAYSLMTSLAPRSIHLTLVTADPAMIAAAQQKQITVLDPGQPVY